MDILLDKFITFVKELQKTDEERHTFMVGIFSTLFFELGVFYELLKCKNIHDIIRYIALGFLFIVICVLLILSSKIYEYYIFSSAEYVLYIVQKGDTLLELAKCYLPECNPSKTLEIIKLKNSIKGTINPGEAILLPTKK
ncbi:MAG: peptidoglycan-binding protein [Bacillota bacterium]|nr:peptidoglycan-binding protein [Bacillota bacterium]